MANIPPAAAHAPKSGMSAQQLDILNGMFDTHDAFGVLRHALIEFTSPPIAMVSSFGADSAVLLHMVAQINPRQEVLFLQTGKHFPATLDYVETMKQHLGLTNVRFLEPDESDLARFDPQRALWRTDPDSCCYIRKTAPLDAALKSYGGWVTGRKRFQTSDREVLPHFELTGDGRIKVNPLAYWDFEDVRAYRAAHNLPPHPLFSAGYLSIGCAPCTSIVEAGEDHCSGRWRGRDKTECGIHLDQHDKGDAPQAKEQRMQLVFKNGQFIDDHWRDLAVDAPLIDLDHVFIPFGLYLEHKEQILSGNGVLGLIVNPGDDVHLIGDAVSRFSAIAIEFPTFGDGRGYSSARLLRERYGFDGELRARGDILTDQVQFLQRCGFDSLEVVDGPTRNALENDAIAGVSVFMQPTGRDIEVPAGTRPFLRRVK